MKAIRQAVACAFALAMLLILGVVLFRFADTAFWCKRAFLLPQGAMLGLGAAALLALGLALTGGQRKPEEPRKAAVLLRFAPWALLLAAQLLLSFHAYFLTGWDVQGIVETAYALAGGEADKHAAYLSMYPNNVPLVLLFAGVIRAVRAVLGNPGLDRCVYVLIAMQCALNTLTGMLLYAIARRATGSARFAGFASIVYVLLIGLSPWQMIPYSDSMALVFPTAALFVYQRGDRLKWPAIGALCGLGYMIKPQAVIAAIAIVLIELGRMAAQLDWRAGIARVASLCAVLALLCGPGMQALIDAAPLEKKPERRMNMLHYAMMGLNTQSNGGYSYDDVTLSQSVGPQRRAAVQMEEIGSRLHAMGAEGLGDHLEKKLLTNFADGSLAWGMEGSFFRAWIADKDARLSPFLKSVIDTSGARHLGWMTGLQCIWLALLLGCALCGVQAVKAGEDVLCAAMLALLGLAAFVMIFEARARYLYLYAPYIVLLGSHGLWRAAVWLKAKLT